MLVEGMNELPSDSEKVKLPHHEYGFVEFHNKAGGCKTSNRVVFV